MISSAEAFLLLTLPNAHLSTPTTNQSGTLALECVTVALPSSNDPGTPPSNRDVYLVLRLNNFETPIDPARVVEISVIENGTRMYRFYGTNTDPSVLVLSITPPAGNNEVFYEDLETFEGIIAQYADLCGTGVSQAIAHSNPTSDLRGHLVLINEDNGEIVGEVDRSFRINEDPSLHEKGRENEPVVIEVPEGAEDEPEGTPIEVFARYIPPDEENWITKGATIVSHVISTTTDLFLTSITSASSHYMDHSKPSPLNAAAGSSASPSNSFQNPPSNNPAPSQTPNRVMFLSSERTLKGLSAVHAISGQAVQVSSKTVTMIDGMIRRAVGGKKKDKQRAGLPYVLGSTPAPGSSHLLTPQGGARPPLPPRSSSPIPQRGPSPVPPPPYSPPGHGYNEKPNLPPRRSPSPLPAPFPPATVSNNALPPLPPRKLGTKAKILLSADLILSTLDESAKKVLDVSSQRLGAVVGHKYGPTAGQGTMHVAGTARNVALVYIDMRGIGRKALMRRAGKEFVKARMSSSRKA